MEDHLHDFPVHNLFARYVLGFGQYDSYTFEVVIEAEAQTLLM